jgi:hypothetical protein
MPHDNEYVGFSELTPEQQAWLEQSYEATNRYFQTGDPTEMYELGLLPTEEEIEWGEIESQLNLAKYLIDKGEALMVDLGAIERVDLRNVWPREAQDFTPWLAENLDKLGEALGLDLEFQEREAPVGPFFLDVLAHDRSSDRPVIIENQLEATNHGHLGQLLTYAAGYDAGVIIWLTGDFQDEHRATLDWLNQRTSEDTQFFGVVVEAWKIDESRPAPHFRIAVAPNSWSKNTAKEKSIVDTGVSVLGERFHAFFQPIVDTIREQHKFTNRTQAGTRSWCGFSSGFSGIGFTPAFALKGKARVEVYIDRGNHDVNKQVFDGLESYKENIETELGDALVWDRLGHRRACRISVVRDGSIGDAPETLEELQDWMVEQLLAFKRVFGPHLAELVE